MMRFLLEKNWLARVPLYLGIALLLAFGASCSRDEAPPKVLSAAELAPALAKAFHNAKPELQAPANQVIASLNNADYPLSFAGLNNLKAQPGLTHEQDSTIASVLLAVNQLLQADQKQGNQQAAQTLQYYRATK